MLWEYAEKRISYDAANDETHEGVHEQDVEGGRGKRKKILLLKGYRKICWKYVLLENSNDLKMKVKFLIEMVFEGIGVVTDPFRNSLLWKKKFMLN